MKRLLVTAFAAFFAPVFLTAVSTPKLVLTTKTYAFASDEKFSCSDELINGYLTLPAPMKGRHVMETVWVKPDGSVEGYSKADIEFPATGGQTAYTWLRFDNGGGLLSSVREGPSGDQTFDGLWKVKVNWDEKQLIETNFQVTCQRG